MGNPSLRPERVSSFSFEDSPRIFAMLSWIAILVLCGLGLAFCAYLARGWTKYVTTPEAEEAEEKTKVKVEEQSALAFELCDAAMVRPHADAFAEWSQRVQLQRARRDKLGILLSPGEKGLVETHDYTPAATFCTDSSASSSGGSAPCSGDSVLSMARRFSNQIQVGSEPYPSLEPASDSAPGSADSTAGCDIEFSALMRELNSRRPARRRRHLPQPLQRIDPKQLWNAEDEGGEEVECGPGCWAGEDPVHAERELCRFLGRLGALKGKLDGRGRSPSREAAVEDNV